MGLSIVEEVNAGGKQAIALTVETVNAYLSQYYPQIPAITSEDFVGARTSTGIRQMEFAREAGDKVRIRTEYVSALTQTQIFVYLK